MLFRSGGAEDGDAIEVAIVWGASVAGLSGRFDQRLKKSLAAMVFARADASRLTKTIGQRLKTLRPLA